MNFVFFWFSVYMTSNQTAVKPSVDYLYNTISSSVSDRQLLINHMQFVISSRNVASWWPVRWQLLVWIGVYSDDVTLTTRTRDEMRLLGVVSASEHSTPASERWRKSSEFTWRDWRGKIDRWTNSQRDVGHGRQSSSSGLNEMNYAHQWKHIEFCHVFEMLNEIISLTSFVGWRRCVFCLSLRRTYPKIAGRKCGTVKWKCQPMSFKVKKVKFVGPYLY